MEAEVGWDDGVAGTKMIITFLGHKSPGNRDPFVGASNTFHIHDLILGPAVNHML